MSGRRPAKNGKADFREPDPADVQAMRAALKRATRRINMLELIILSAAAIAALAAGWLAALLGERAFDLSFRRTWLIASLALFLLPALVALLMEKRRRTSQAKPAGEQTGQRPEGDGE